MMMMMMMMMSTFPPSFPLSHTKQQHPHFWKQTPIFCFHTPHAQTISDFTLPDINAMVTHSIPKQIVVEVNLSEFSIWKIKNIVHNNYFTIFHNHYFTINRKNNTIYLLRSTSLPARAHAFHTYLLRSTYG